MNQTVLIVDDDKQIAGLIDFRLKRQGYATHCVYKGLDALEYIKNAHPALVMLDIRLPDLSGVEVLKEFKQSWPDGYAIMISAHADVKLAVECMQLGAEDFLEKPFDLSELDTKVRRVFEKVPPASLVLGKGKKLDGKFLLRELIGSSRAMKKVFESVGLAAKSNASVLVEGESGTGKELVARAIHAKSAQASHPFVAVNCSAIPENLLESELFGHEKGAFTGALARKMGKFERAQAGTIFLDEIGDLPTALQAKLLRVLQEREIEKVGGNELIPIDARFIAATNRDLKKLVAEQKFREDLYFRVNVFSIRLPALRERTGDIPQLISYFLAKHGRDPDSVRIETPVLERLLAYPWSGNVRELENFVERALLTKRNRDSITEEDIESLDLVRTELVASPTQAQALGSFGRPLEALRDQDKTLLEAALAQAGGNVSKACRALGISRDTFYRKMKKYSVSQT